MINVQDFVREVQRIADTRPTYRTGGSGTDGTCDCIGLIMGAMYALGHERYDLHSTNYFARYQMATLDRLTSAGQLFIGAIVYKDRVSMSQLHERYQNGGRYFTGDLLDYYHVGVVTGVDPLEITHCTSTNNVDGIAYDDSIDGWTQFGMLEDVAYIIDADPEGEQPEPVKRKSAVVRTPDGNPVNLREDPSTRNPYIAKIPDGDAVEVLESADGWATVRWNGQRGYMMSQFIQSTAMEEEQPGEAVTITLSKSAAEELYKALGGALV